MAVRYEYCVFEDDKLDPVFVSRVKTEAIRYARSHYGVKERLESISITQHRLFVPFSESGACILKWDKGTSHDGRP